MGVELAPSATRCRGEDSEVAVAHQWAFRQVRARQRGSGGDRRRIEDVGVVQAESHHLVSARETSEQAAAVGAVGEVSNCGAIEAQPTGRAAGVGHGRPLP
jgi:hypothetical protein